MSDPYHGAQTVHLSPESAAELIEALRANRLWPLPGGIITIQWDTARIVLCQSVAHRILRLLGTSVLPACRGIARAFPLPLGPAEHGSGVLVGGNGRPDGGLHVVPPAPHTTY